jgi:hypothetical protein
MRIELTVPAKYIQALKLFAAKKDIRYYLKAINFEIGKEESRMIASDGVKMGVFRLISPQSEIKDPIGNVIIPIEVFKSIKTLGDIEISIGEVAVGCSGRLIKISNAGGMPLTVVSMDNHYPDYRRLFLNVGADAETVSQFDPQHLYEIGKAYKALHVGNKKMLSEFPLIKHSGKTAALIDLGDENFTGLIHPLRIDCEAVCPKWVTAAF